jgi:hypothetical protein
MLNINLKLKIIFDLLKIDKLKNEKFSFPLIKILDPR